MHKYLNTINWSLENFGFLLFRYIHNAKIFLFLFLCHYNNNRRWFVLIRRESDYLFERYKWMIHITHQINDIFLTKSNFETSFISVLIESVASLSPRHIIYV